MAFRAAPETIEEYVEDNVVCACDHVAGTHNRDGKGPCDGLIKHPLKGWTGCGCPKFERAITQ